MTAIGTLIYDPAFVEADKRPMAAVAKLQNNFWQPLAADSLL